MVLPSMVQAGSYIPGPHELYTAFCAAVSAGDSATIAPTFSVRLGHPSRRDTIAGANELSTVEWQNAHVMPTRVSVLFASTCPTTPTTALSLSSVTVVA